MDMKGRVARTRLASRRLEGNPLGDPAERDVYVYLPPGYDEGSRRYPVVMLLPGFAGTHRSMLGFDPFKPNPVERFDRLVGEGRCPEALLVLPDAMTRWGGSQFVDSAATGPYQSYLADEVLPHVDGAFRTIPEREARAVAGRSSGGFGALRLGMDRPDVVGAIGSHAGDAAFEVSMRPMFTSAAIAYERAGGLEAFAERVVDRGPRGGAELEALLVLANATAYSPDPDAPPPHAALPFDPRTATLRPDVWSRWLAHDPLERIEQAARGAAAIEHDAADALRRMSLVFLDAGNHDEHGLCFAARMLAERMKAVGARVHYDEFDGGHRGTSYRYEDSLPLLVQALEHE